MNTDRKRLLKLLSAFIFAYLWFQIAFLSFSLAVEGIADNEPDKLKIPINDIPLEDKKILQKIIKDKDMLLSWRGEEIETNTAIFNYLISRPVLTSIIMTELDIANYQIEKDDGSFKYDDGHGLSGDLKIAYKKDKERIYQGNYIYTAGVEVPVRLSGEAALILKYEEKDELLGIDIDLYLTISNEGIGRITKDLPFILKSIMTEKVDFYISSVRELSELIYSDTEDVFDRLKESGEIKERDLKEFKSVILKDKR
jgi:hypothetical protein